MAQSQFFVKNPDGGYGPPAGFTGVGNYVGQHYSQYKDTQGNLYSVKFPNDDSRQSNSALTQLIPMGGSPLADPITGGQSTGGHSPYDVNLNAIPVGGSLSSPGVVGAAYDPSKPPQIDTGKGPQPMTPQQLADIRAQGAAQQSISKYASDASTSLAPTVPTRGTTTPTVGSSLSGLIEQVNQILGTRPQSPDLLAQRGTLASQPGGLNDVQNELQIARDELAAFEQKILSESDKIKGKKGVSTAFVGGKLSKLDADTAEAYRTAQNKVNKSIERYNIANTTLNSMMELTQKSYENSVSEYNTKFTQFMKFYDVFKTEEDQHITRNRADGDAIISTVKANPGSFKNITPEMEAEWDRIDLAGERPKGFIKGLATAMSSGALSDFEYKGTFGSADGGYYTQLYNQKTGELKTVRATSGYGNAGGAVVESANTPPGLVDAFNFMSARLSKDEAQRATKYFNGLINSGDYTTAQEYLKSTSIANLPPTEQGKAFGRFVAIDALNTIKSELADFVASGGNTNILTGSIEKISQKVGTTSNPTLASIGNKIILGMIAYRNAVSGAAFTESEQQQYAMVFPSTGNVPTLNNAKIDSLLDVFNLNNKSVFSQILGPTNYDKIFTTLPQSKPNITPSQATNFLDGIVSGNTNSTPAFFGNFLSVFGL